MNSSTTHRECATLESSLNHLFVKMTDGFNSEFAKDFGGPITTVIMGAVVLATNLLIRKDVQEVRDDVNKHRLETIEIKTNIAAVKENLVWKLRETRSNLMAEIAKIKTDAPDPSPLTLPGNTRFEIAPTKFDNFPV